MAVAYGLPNDAALKSLTLWSAQITGVDNTLGSLEAGKSATLIVTSGDPLEITTRIDAAYIDGRQIDLSNKQTKLAEKYRARYKQ
jgi:imidazolonepropionase-like amidohydrolase